MCVCVFVCVCNFGALWWAIYRMPIGYMYTVYDWLHMYNINIMADTYAYIHIVVIITTTNTLDLSSPTNLVLLGTTLLIYNLHKIYISFKFKRVEKNDYKYGCQNEKNMSE